MLLILLPYFSTHSVRLGLASFLALQHSDLAKKKKKKNAKKVKIHTTAKVHIIAKVKMHGSILVSECSNLHT